MPIELPDSFWNQTWTHQREVAGQIKGGLLAAGLGSRMSPLTTGRIPKPMFPLGGRVPMAELWVRRFVESGITDISMNLCVLAGAIRDHFSDGARYGANISYAGEDEPTGTLGGVCKQALGSEARAVLPGESTAGLQLAVPDHSTLSRRGQRWRPPLRAVRRDAPLHLFIDATGLHAFGEGEWAAAKHGGKGRRGWRKLHVAVGALYGFLGHSFARPSGRGGESS